MMERAFLGLAFCVVIASGCTLGRITVGDPLTRGAQEQLYAGQPQAEVLERLGPPDRVGLVWGEAIFEYFYREQLDRELELSLFQASFDYDEVFRKSDRLVVRFDLEGRVRDYGLNLQTQRGRDPD